MKLIIYIDQLNLIIQMSISSSKVSRDSKKIRVNKMKFTNYDLSYKVRQRLYEILITFDDNLNYQFQEEQIQKALISLLGESKVEVVYVTKNVFRYDRNNDGIITYEEFTNFCLEQHFGQMAIQRLHKKGLYSRGKDRIMNLDEFNKTLLYCLSFIKIKPELSSLRQIFADIDTQQKGHISYSQYFTFLKEYFGSLSKSAQQIRIDIVNQAIKHEKGLNTKQQPQTRTQPQSIIKYEQQNRRNEEQNKIQEQKKKIQTQNRKGEQENRRKQQEERRSEGKRRIKEQENKKRRQQEANRIKQTDESKKICKRIARLIYQQLKVTAMNFDRNQSLSIDETIGRQLMLKHFKLEPKDYSLVLQYLSEPKTSYENFLQCVVELFMCEIVPQKIKFPLKKDSFVQEMKKYLEYVNIVPSTFMLEDAFCSIGEEMEKNEFILLMRKIFTNYAWPRLTGQPRKFC